MSRVRVLLKEGKSGKFRRLKVGETVEPGDVMVFDCFYDTPTDAMVGKPCNDRDVIVRLEFI